MSTIHTIAISTGGGDCPGLNAVIRAATKAAILQHGWRVLGIADGFDGLMFPDAPGRMQELTLATVSGILPRGGTILGTTNRGNPFRYSVMKDGQQQMMDMSAQVVENARKLGIDAVIVVGGDGTQAIALELQQKGMNVVGVPKTIDNDLQATDVTFGFDTALHTATDAVDKIHTTAESHHRIMVVEVMGREAGWIALHTGIAGGAHMILIPEIPLSLDKIGKFVAERHQSGKKFTIVVVAEGIQPPPELLALWERERRAFPRSGAMGNLIGDAIGMISQQEVRVTVLGHIQRGGSPSPFDRILGTRFGVAAVQLIAEGKFGHMVCLRGTKIEAAPIAEAIGAAKLVDPQGNLVRTARAIGISFGD